MNALFSAAWAAAANCAKSAAAAANVGSRRMRRMDFDATTCSALQLDGLLRCFLQMNDFDG